VGIGWAPWPFDPKFVLWLCCVGEGKVLRYQKGSIALNDRKDTPILRFVADSLYVTHSQLYFFSRVDEYENNRRVFNWRIRRLVRNGLVRKQMLPFLGGEPLYSISRGGIRALEQMGVYYLGANLDRERDPQEAQIPHALELNNIRLALHGTGMLCQWIPEPFIRILSLSPGTSYAKVYDGIAKVQFDGQYIRLAIEYERTLKSQLKYEKIRQAIESEKRLHGFLYLVPSLELIWALIDEFYRTRRLVFFALVDDFKRDVFGVKVWAPSFCTTSLKEALLKVAALEKI